LNHEVCVTVSNGYQPVTSQSNCSLRCIEVKHWKERKEKLFTLPGKCVQNRLSDLSILREKLYSTEIMSSPYLYMEAFQVTSSIKLEDIKVYQSCSCFSEEFEELLGHSDEIEHLSENLIVKIECSSQVP
jgi:hypothetical protein